LGEKLNGQRTGLLNLNETVLPDGKETDKAVLDDEEVCVIFGQSENGNFRAVGSVRGVPFGADSPSPFTIIEHGVEFWGNKELTRFLFAIKDRARVYGFVGFSFRKK